MKLKELIRRIAAKNEVGMPFADNLEAYLDHFIPNVLVKSETLQKAFDVTFYEMEEIYSEAYAFYQEDNYLEAATAFRWLVLLNPFVSKYWTGLAASLQLLEKYEKSLHAYAVSSLLENDNPFLHVHACECYMAMNQWDEAEKALDLAQLRAVNKPQYLDLQREIDSLRKELLCSDYKTRQSPQ
jgi:type III secretion system low calcium response chaperone LcrH/SycD